MAMLGQDVEKNCLIQKIAKGWKDSHGLLFFLRKGNLRGSLDSHKGDFFARHTSHSPKS